MGMITSRTFRNGDSEAVILPAEVAFGADVDVEIVKHGDVVTIRPRAEGRMTLQEMVEALEKLPKPKNPIGREPIEFPERPGL